MALTGWNIAKIVQLRIGKRSSALVNLPVLVNLTTASGPTACDCSKIFTEILFANRKKIAVEVGDSGQECYVEIERWDDANNSAQLWVQVPLIDTADDTLLRVYYDINHADNTSHVGDIGSTPGRAVWDADYVSVYHLSQDPAGTIYDSTSNAHNLVTYGGMTVGGNQVAGPTGKATWFDGNDDRMTTSGAQQNWTAMQTAHTLEMVCKAPAAVTDLATFLFAGPYTNSAPWIGAFVGGVMAKGLWNYMDGSTVAIAFNTWKGYGAVYAAGATRTIGNGIIATGTYTRATASLATSEVWISERPGVTRFQNTVRSVRISKIARSADWILASYESDFDLLITYSTPLPTAIAQYDLVYRIATQVVGQIDLPYTFPAALKVVVDLPYRSSTTLKSQIDMPYASATMPRAQVDLPYTHNPTAKQIVDLAYVYQVRAFAQVDMPYLFGAALVRNQVDLSYRVSDQVSALAVVDLPYWHTEPATLVSYTETVTVDGHPVDPISIDLSWSRDQYAISVNLTLADQPDYALCQPGSVVVVTIWGDAYIVLVESRSRRRVHGDWSYSVSCLSEASRLDAPYAETESGEYTGMASTIADSLAGSVPLTWNTVDWSIPAATLIAADQTPLAIIRSLAAACGGMLLSLPDGSLSVEPAYPVAVNRWSETSPALVLRESLDVFESSEEDDHRPGYNVYLISDQMASAETLRIDDEAEGELEHLLRVYQTPWVDNFDFRHTGGNWVQVEDLGVEERAVEETIEFVAGEGRTGLPIYAITAVSWRQVGLGTVTFSEDGLLVAAVDGESLLAITYTTRCRCYRALNSRIEEVQFVAEEETA